MRNRIARIISILGHPLLVLPAALTLPAALRNDDPHALRWMLTGFALFAALVLGGAWLQVRRGRWAHVDASEPSERRSLNRVLWVALVVGAVATWRGLPAPDLGLTLALSAVIVSLAMLTVRACKLSLHVAFSVFAASLLWPWGVAAVAAGLAFASAVGWSRLHLGRHRPRDLVAGAGAGALASLLYWPALHGLRISP